MKRIAQSFPIGLAACGISWLLVLSTNSELRLHGDNGPFLWLWFALVIPMSISSFANAPTINFIIGTIAFSMIAGIIINTAIDGFKKNK
jgi:hypothetical protein